VTAINDVLPEGDETVVATVLPDPAYVVGAANTATVRIISNE
jgi:hypothetical protein